MEGSTASHALSLKVMRLSRPTLASSPQPFFEDHPALREHAVNSVLSLQGKDDFIGYPKTVRDLTTSEILTLPATFGSIQLGETFTGLISLNNDSFHPSFLPTQISLLIEMQTSTVKLPLGQNPTTTDSLAPTKSLQVVVSHEIKELGQHVLGCTVRYKIPKDLVGSYPVPAEDGAGDPTIRVLRKFYKFMVTNPLSVKTKVQTPKSQNATLLYHSTTGTSERDKVFLEVHIQNLTTTPLSFERIEFQCVEGWTVRDMNRRLYSSPALSKDDDERGEGAGGANRPMPPQEIRQFLYVLSPLKTSLFKVEEKPGSVIPLGRLDIRWTSSWGEPGRLLTSLLSRRVPLPPPPPPPPAVLPATASSPAPPPGPPLPALPPHVQPQHPHTIRPQSPSMHSTTGSSSSRSSSPAPPPVPFKVRTPQPPPHHQLPHRPQSPAAAGSLRSPQMSSTNVSSLVPSPSSTPAIRSTSRTPDLGLGSASEVAGSGGDSDVKTALMIRRLPERGSIKEMRPFEVGYRLAVRLPANHPVLLSVAEERERSSSSSPVSGSGPGEATEAEPGFVIQLLEPRPGSTDVGSSAAAGTAVATTTLPATGGGQSTAIPTGATQQQQSRRQEIIQRQEKRQDTEGSPTGTPRRGHFSWSVDASSSPSNPSATRGTGTGMGPVVISSSPIALAPLLPETTNSGAAGSGGEEGNLLMGSIKSEEPLYPSPVVLFNRGTDSATSGAEGLGVRWIGSSIILPRRVRQVRPLGGVSSSSGTDAKKERVTVVVEGGDSNLTAAAPAASSESKTAAAAEVEPGEEVIELEFDVMFVALRRGLVNLGGSSGGGPLQDGVGGGFRLLEKLTGRIVEEWTRVGEVWVD